MMPDTATLAEVRTCGRGHKKTGANLSPWNGGCRLCHESARLIREAASRGVVLPRYAAEHRAAIALLERAPEVAR